MKKILLLLMLAPVFALCQTADYTQYDFDAKASTSHSIFYDIGIDTLTGSNDTLVIAFDRTFPAFYGATYTGVLAASSTSTTAKVEILGRNKSSETWVIIDDLALSSESVTLSLTADVNYLNIALRVVSTTGNVHLNSSFLLKKKSSSAAAGGGASYLVYTALLTQSGTNAPVATVLENTLGGTVVWSYSNVGTYDATLSNAFTQNKTTAMLSDLAWNDFSGSSLRRTSASVLRLNIMAGNDFLDSSNQAFVEIRVYP